MECVAHQRPNYAPLGLKSCIIPKCATSKLARRAGVEIGELCRSARRPDWIGSALPSGCPRSPTLVLSQRYAGHTFCPPARTDEPARVPNGNRTPHVVSFVPGRCGCGAVSGSSSALVRAVPDGVGAFRNRAGAGSGPRLRGRTHCPRLAGAVVGGVCDPHYGIGIAGFHWAERAGSNAGRWRSHFTCGRVFSSTSAVARADDSTD